MQSSHFKEYKYGVMGLGIVYEVDYVNNVAHLSNINLATDKMMNESTRLKAFCIMIRNSTSYLINQGIKQITHIILKKEFNEIKNVTQWKVLDPHVGTCEIGNNEHQYCSQTECFYAQTILVVCDISDFVTNMGKGLGIDIKM